MTSGCFIVNQMRTAVLTIKNTMNIVRHCTVEFSCNLHFGSLTCYVMHLGGRERVEFCFRERGRYILHPDVT